MDNRDLPGELRKLLAKLDLLAVAMHRLQDENRSLRHQLEQMSGERAQLIAKAGVATVIALSAAALILGG